MRFCGNGHLCLLGVFWLAHHNQQCFASFITMRSHGFQANARFGPGFLFEIEFGSERMFSRSAPDARWPSVMHHFILHTAPASTSVHMGALTRVLRLTSSFCRIARMIVNSQ